MRGLSGCAILDAIRHEIWDDNYLGNAIPGATPRARIDVRTLVPGLPLTGGCLCGGVRYEIDEELVSASYCHCTRCRRRTGTGASPEARIVPGSLRIVQGDELVREWRSEGGRLLTTRA